MPMQTIFIVTESYQGKKRYLHEPFKKYQLQNSHMVPVDRCELTQRWILDIMGTRNANQDRMQQKLCTKRGLYTKKPIAAPAKPS